VTTRTKKFALSVRAEAYEKLKAEAARRGVTLGKLVEEMVEKAEKQ